MFSFDPIADIDLDYFEYQLRQGSTSGTLINSVLSTDGVTQISGTNKANVFTVSVANSTSSTTTSYFGRVRTVSTSGARSSWSTYDGSGDTPLIDSQYIQSLTADKIASGTIASKEITLSGTNAVIQSLSYQQNPNNGWYIKGDGIFQFGGAQGITFSGTKVYFGTDVLISGNTTVGALSVGTSPSILEINSSVPGLKVGTSGHNYWKTDGTFKVGTANKYLEFDGTSTLKISAELVGANGTFTGELSGGTIKIGSGENVFKADANGIYLGNETFSSAEFRVTPAGALTATNATITGTITGSTVSGSTVTGSTVTVGSFDGANTGLRITSDGFIQGSGTGVKIKSWGGEVGWAFYGDLIDGPKIQCNMYSERGGSYLQIGTAGFLVKGDDYLRNRVSTQSRYPVAVRASDDNLVVSAAISSSLRYKENINNLNIDLDKFMEINPVSFYFKKDYLVENDPSDIQYGVIAEQVDELGFNDFVFYDKENLPDGVKYDFFIPVLLQICKRQQNTIDNLLNRVDELESRLV